MSTQVPALAPTPALSALGEIDANDIQRRRLYIGQPLSQAVTSSIAKNGDLFVSSGQDDPEPEVLWTGTYDAEKNPGLLVHILNLRKGWSKKIGNEFMVYAYDADDRPEDADLTYNFEVALPEHDSDLPYKWTLSRSGAGAARKMVEVMVRNSISGPPHYTAFRVWSSMKEKSGVGKYWVAQVKPVEAEQKNVDVAEQLCQLVAPAPAPKALASGNQPSI